MSNGVNEREEPAPAPNFEEVIRHLRAEGERLNKESERAGYDAGLPLTKRALQFYRAANILVDCREMAADLRRTAQRLHRTAQREANNV